MIEIALCVKNTQHPPTTPATSVPQDAPLSFPSGPASSFLYSSFHYPCRNRPTVYQLNTQTKQDCQTGAQTETPGGKKSNNQQPSKPKEDTENYITQKSWAGKHTNTKRQTLTVSESIAYQSRNGYASSKDIDTERQLLAKVANNES